ncbi:MAG: hypothetical protein GWO20_08345 [Candidatus Korarchaeota archaeon]|nr:hypothetical protein [Candidatus Korarchaeota archaeon]NIU82026.1 hypothetical protein [Candidatus Thorarchaeota archaeon]NIW13850.1 hypothetical protein [Candidatus Thorarchaeota archaeon]NIW51961.1 hypothetical protein [Candidatus Korarchaeota archaeon]
MGKEKKKVLPSYNLVLEKQIDVLKAYATYCEEYEKPVNYKKIANLTDIHHTQVSGCRKFWESIGFLKRKGRAKDIPTEKLEKFVSKLSWGEEQEAFEFLGRHLNDEWFVKHTFTQLKLGKKDQEALINSLGKTIGLTSKKKKKVKSIRMLVDLMEKCNLIEKDEDGMFTISSGVRERTQFEVLPEEEMVIIVIEGEKYAIPSEDLKEFVKEEGSKLSKKEHHL